MRVFVTGATGFIGSAVVKELLAAGHSVVGLCRSDDKAKVLVAAGAEVQHGSIEDTDVLKQGAARADGVIHLAFNHDFSKFAESSAADRRAIEAIGSELTGSGRPFIVTSGVGLLAQDRPATEADMPPPRFRMRTRGRPKQPRLHWQRAGCTRWSCVCPRSTTRRVRDWSLP